MSYTKKSPWVIHYDASSCNGCDIEVLAALCPGFDAERFGVINTGNPKHADIFLVTGSVNERNIKVIQEIYDQMIEPKVVVACGICACTGGIFHDCYNVIGGVDKAIPVDVYAPGCAVRPESIIDAVVQGIEVLDKKAKALKRGELVGQPAGVQPSQQNAAHVGEQRAQSHGNTQSLERAQGHENAQSLERVQSHGNAHNTEIVQDPENEQQPSEV